MWFQNQSQSLQSEAPYLYSYENFTTYTANQHISQISSEQASTSKYPDCLQNQWSSVNSSHVPVDSSSFQQLTPHYSASKESTQSSYTPKSKVNLDSAKGEFEKECDNFIYQCRSLKKGSRSKSRTPSFSSLSSISSEKRSRSPSTKRQNSYSQERSPKRLRAFSFSRHDKVKKSNKEIINVRDRSVSPTISRDRHSRHFSWSGSHSDTDNDKYLKFYKSIEKTTLKNIIKEVSKLFDRSSGSTEEAWKCLRDLHKRELVEYRKNPEFHPLYSFEKKRWDSHMKKKGFDLHHDTVEREWNRYFNVVLEKYSIDSWHKREKKLLKKLQNSKKNKSSGNTNSYSSSIKSDSKHRSSSFSRDKGADRRHQEDRSPRKRSSSPSLREKKYPWDHYRDLNTRKRDRSSEKSIKSTKAVRNNREENKGETKQPLREKPSPHKIRRISEASRSSRLSNKDEISSRAGNNKHLSLKQNPSLKKYVDYKNAERITSNYVKKEPLEAGNKHNISVKSRLTFTSPSKPSIKDRLYIPWETKKKQLIGNPESATEIIPSKSSLAERISKYKINDSEKPSDKTTKIRGNKNDNSNDNMDGELKTELSNYSPHMNMFSVLKQMKDKFGSFADSISEMYNTMSELNKEDKNLINYIDSDAETLLLLIKDKINDFMSDKKTSLIQKAIYLETLTNLSSFLTEVKEKDKALAEVDDENKSNLVKEIDIESLVKAVAGKDCKETINFIKEYIQFRKLNVEREDIMSVYMDVKKHQSTLVIYDKLDEQSDMNNKSEEQLNEKKDQNVLIKSPKNNWSKHSTVNMDRSKENSPSIKSRISSPKRLSKTHVLENTVISRSGKKLIRENLKTDSNAKTSYVKATNSSYLSQSSKNEHSFKMQLKKSSSSSVSSVNILTDRSFVCDKTNSRYSDHKNKSSKFSIPPISSIGQLVTLSLEKKKIIFQNFSKYNRDEKYLLNKYLSNIMVTNKDLGNVLSKCKM